MPRKRYSEEQIFSILKESQSGVKTVELCRKHAMSQNTFYKWKNKYGGMELSDIKRLKHLEHENTRLKQMVADLMLDNKALKAISEKNW